TTPKTPHDNDLANDLIRGDVVAYPPVAPPPPAVVCRPDLTTQRLTRDTHPLDELSPQPKPGAPADLARPRPSISSPRRPRYRSRTRALLAGVSLAILPACQAVGPAFGSSPAEARQNGSD